MAWEPQPGTQIAGYRLTRELGRGGFGAVWQATRADNGASVAIKFLHATVDHADVLRFQREAAILGKLRHPNCVALIDSGYVPECGAYIVTEYLDGESLSDWARRGPGVDEIRRVAIQVAEALAEAHRCGITHRDLKPANVLIVASPSGPQAKVLDFGIGKLANEQAIDVTKTGEVLGTPGFMSPEQLRGLKEIGPATDQYCLGVLLFELLEGRHPYRGNNPMALSLAHLTEPVPDLGPRAPADLRRIVPHLMAKEPAARFVSMNAVVGALRGHPAPAERPRASWKAIGAGALGATAAIVALFAYAGRERPAPPSPVARATTVSPLLIATPPTRPTAPTTATADAPSVGSTCPVGREGLNREGFETGPLSPPRQVSTFVPRSFSRDRPTGIVLLLQEGGPRGHDPEYFLDYTGFEEIAERNNLILVLPDNTRGLGGSWRREESITEAWIDVETVRDAWCLRSAPVFVLGEGAGAEAADRLVCKLRGEIAAVAVSAHMWLAKRDVCSPEHPVPYLHLVQMLDRIEPMDGNPTCRVDDDPRVPLDDQQERLRGAHGCDGARKPYSDWDSPDGTCYTWECKVPYFTCMVDAGRDWKLVAGRQPEIAKCVGEPAASFPYGDVVWNFFDLHRERAAPPSP